jgi:hypothetical protein
MLRMPAALKARLKAYADDVGISSNTAALILIRKALASEESK